MRLPIDPSIEDLRRQAERLVRRDPVLSIAQAEAQVAETYGCRDWAELVVVVGRMNEGRERLQGDDSASLPLAEAANRNDLDRVRAILASGRFHRLELDRALARAVLRFAERRAIAELLIAHGADPDGQYGGAYGPIALVTGECLDPDGMRFLAEHGADLAFAPVASKYGPASMLGSVLGTYARDARECKHRCIDLLLAAAAPLPAAASPAVLAVHRGDAEGLSRALAADPGLATRRIADLPYGNTVLAGATLLHAAVEFEEPACVDVLLAAGADINATATLSDGIGGQTPIFHAVAIGWEADTPWRGKLAMATHLLARAGRRIDWGVRAALRRSDGTVTSAMTADGLAAGVAAGTPAAEVAVLLRAAAAG